MKKLMTVVAAALMGLSVSAATVDWSVDVYDLAAGGADTTTYTLYAFSAGDTASTLAAALNTGGKFDEAAYNSALSSATKSTASFDDAGWADGNSNGVTEGGAISFLILTDGTTENSTFYYANNVDITGYTYTPPAGSPGAFYVDYSSFSSGTVGSVPEPTSGLLMLIGMAGLALRRKRA